MGYKPSSDFRHRASRSGGEHRTAGGSMRRLRGGAGPFTRQAPCPAPEEECESEMFVWVGRAGEQVAVPLAQLQPLSKDQETQEAVGDWLYWVDRGHEL